MPRRIELAPTPALLAGALVLGLVIQFASPRTPLLADAPAGTLGRTAARVKVSANTVEPHVAHAPAYPAILDRPLFSPSRSSAAAVAGNVAPLGALALLGVASDGGRASATLALGGAAPRSLRLGEVIGGWRLSGVGRDHAILDRGGVVQVLKVGAPVQAPANTAAVSGVPTR